MLTVPEAAAVVGISLAVISGSLWLGLEVMDRVRADQGQRDIQVLADAVQRLHRTIGPYGPTPPHAGDAYDDAFTAFVLENAGLPAGMTTGDPPALFVADTPAVLEPGGAHERTAGGLWLHADAVGAGTPFAYVLRVGSRLEPVDSVAVCTSLVLANPPQRLGVAVRGRAQLDASAVTDPPRPGLEVDPAFKCDGEVCTYALLHPAHAAPPHDLPEPLGVLDAVDVALHCRWAVLEQGGALVFLGLR